MTYLSIPIGVRVFGIIALVLVGIVVSSMLVRASSGMDYQRGPGHGSQMQGMQGMDHSGGQTGPAAPSGNPTPSHVRPNH